MRGLKRLRRLSGLTQHQLARSSRTDRSKLSLAETGQVRLTPEEENRVREALMRAINNRAKETEKVLAAVGGSDSPTAAEAALVRAGPAG